MAGLDNEIHFNRGVRISPTSSTQYPILQKAATDVGEYNNAGSPEGVVSANVGSTCRDRTNGVLYIKRTGTGNTGWSATSTTDLHAPKFIVGDTANGANYSTIAAAIAAASSGDTVYIQTGTYTENITLVSGVNLAALGSDCAVTNQGSNAASYEANVTILGTVTASYTGRCNLYGIKLQTNGAAAIATSGGVSQQLRLINCFVYANDATGITMNNSSGNINFIGCYFRSTGANILFANTANSGIQFSNCIFGLASGAGDSTHASGGMTINNCLCNTFTFSTSSTATFNISNSLFSKGARTLITTSGTDASNLINNSVFISSTASALSIGSGTTVTMSNCVISSTNTNAITGAGTLVYSGLTFSDTSSNINVTTQTVRAEGPSRTIGSSNSGLANVLTVTNTSNTASSSAQVVVSTAGSTAADPTTLWSTTTTNWIAGIDNSVTSPTDDPWVLAQGTALGTNNVMSVATSGEINYPLQPAFLAYVNTSIPNVTGDGTVYTIIYDTEVFDQNSDFNLGTSVFTAPVTGRYQFNMMTLLITGTVVISQLGRIVTSNNVFRYSGYNNSGATTTGVMYSSVLCDMDAADTASITVVATDSGGKIDDVAGVNAGDVRTSFSGNLVC